MTELWPFKGCAIMGLQKEIPEILMDADFWQKLAKIWPKMFGGLTQKTESISITGISFCNH